MISSDLAEFKTQGPRTSGFFRLLSNRNYALLWWGQLVSEIGNRFHWVAISLWIYSETRSASAVSIAISAMFAGSLLVSLWAGVIVDYFDRRRSMIISDIVRAILVALIPPLMQVNLWLVYLDLILISMATAFFRPALFSIVPQVVRRNDLLPANSFMNAMDTGTEVAGPALAGIVAAKFGYAPLLFLDAGTYLVSAACIAGMAIPTTVGQFVRKIDPRGVWEGVREGLHYIRDDSLQWGLFVLLFPVALVGATLNALQTPLAKGVIGISDPQFGTFQGVWGVGFVVASFLLGWYGAKLQRNLLVVGGYFLVFLAAALMGLSNSFAALAAAAFGVGFANTLYYVGLNTTLMEYSPQNILGRVISIRQLAIGLVRVIIPLLLGYLADEWGTRETIISVAGVSAIMTVAIIFALPSARRFEPTAVRSVNLRSVLWRALAGQIESQFDRGDQHRLGLISIIIAVVAWLGLALALPLYAFALIFLVPLFVAFHFVRKKGWMRAGGG